MKVLTMDELAKAAGGLGGHFGKASSMHKSAAAHHESLHKHHSEMAAFSKGKHDAMDDGHEMKAYMAKAAEHHAAKAAHHLKLHKLHKAHGEECDDMAKTFSADKALAAAATAGAPAPAAAATPAAPAAAPTGGDGISAMVSETTAGLVKKSLEMLNSDPAVQDEIRKMVLEGVRSALGDKIVPTDVRAILPDMPGGSAAAPVAHPRAGAPPVPTADVPPEFRALVEM